MSPLGLLSCLDGSTVVDISAISARAAAWCFVLKCPYCVSWKLVLCGIGTLREEPRQDPLVILTEYGGSVMIRNFAYTRQSPTRRPIVEHGAGVKQQPNFILTVLLGEPSKSLSRAPPSTQAWRAATHVKPGTARGLYTASCVRLPLSLCASDPFVPRGLGEDSWCFGRLVL